MSNKIITLIGKSCSGKDTAYKRVCEELKQEGLWDELNIVQAVMHTTRPMRPNETEGVQYHFCDVDFYKQEEEANRVIECRPYNTKYGIWYYFTHKSAIDLDNHNYFNMNTIEGFNATKAYFETTSSDILVPIYLFCDDGVRLQRAINRELERENPQYDEMCRRFLADQSDFSEENLSRIPNLTRIDNNKNLNDTVAELKDVVIKSLKR